MAYTTCPCQALYLSTHLMQQSYLHFIDEKPQAQGGPDRQTWKSLAPEFMVYQLDSFWNKWIEYNNYSMSTQEGRSIRV